LNTPLTVPAAAVAPPGEFSTGWPTLVLALAGVATSVSALLIYSLGTFIVPLEAALGWSRAELQIAVSFLAAGGALSVNLVGWLNLHYGMRAVSAVSMLAVALAFASLALMKGSIGWMYLGYFVLPFIGLGTTPVTWTHIVALHFHRHRGLALSLALCGTGLSAAFLPSLLAWAIGRWGWQAGYVALAGLPFAMWLSTSWRFLPARGAEHIVVRSPAATQTATSGMPFAQALRNGKFWLLNIGLGLVVSAVYGMATNTVPLASAR
jgi:MFS family permease